MLTEKRNERSQQLHNESTYDVLKIMNEEDKTIAPIIEAVLSDIERAVEVMVTAIEKGGSVFYMGAGTSGRLGVLDASECPPTFGVDTDVFRGIIAGGDRALRDAIENAEDSLSSGAEDVDKYVKPTDVVVGIASSGQTPYVLGAVNRARELGVKTIGISCNEKTRLSNEVDIAIELAVGAEVVTGSTRLKAGTAQKMVLNMLSTATMVKTGKVYENLMVNLQATNKKLHHRAASIIQELTGVDEEGAIKAYESANGDTRVAILIVMFEVDKLRALNMLEKYNGNFVKALNEFSRK